MIVVLLVVWLLTAAATYAFTAAVTVSPSSAGDGSAAVTSPSVTSMQLQYDSNTPTQVSNAIVSFSTSVTSVKARFTGGSWSSACTGSGTGPWTCNWSGGTPLPTSGQTLRVVAVG